MTASRGAASSVSASATTTTAATSGAPWDEEKAGEEEEEKNETAEGNEDEEEKPSLYKQAKTKLKVMVAFAQLVSSMGFNIGIKFPAGFSALLSSLDGISNLKGLGFG